MLHRPWTRTTLHAVPMLAALTGALPAAAATIVVDSTADENSTSPVNAACTLREAVLAANGNVALGDCDAGAYEVTGCGASLALLLPPTLWVGRRRRRGGA